MSLSKNFTLNSWDFKVESKTHMQHNFKRHHHLLKLSSRIRHGNNLFREIGERLCSKSISKSTQLLWMALYFKRASKENYLQHMGMVAIWNEIRSKCPCPRGHDAQHV